MDISNTNNSASLTQMLGGVNVRQQQETAVLKMANNQAKQDGENALRLVQSVPGAKPQGPLGNNLDATA